jgi:hypothetical protein
VRNEPDFKEVIVSKFLPKTWNKGEVSVVEVLLCCALLMVFVSSGLFQKMSATSLYCKRCGVIVIKAGVGVLVEANEATSTELMSDDGTVEEISTWISVRDMFSFENVGFSREHKSIVSGERLLTCAGCEKGIFGRAVKKGDGPEAKMESLLAPSRLKNEK